MSRPVIEVRNLSKRYRLGAIGATSLRDEFRRAWDRVRGRPHPEQGDFWALRDVSFDIQPGEVVGVIGRNGAGKSTLLKILSRITEPTTGEAVLRGRVASLLEVGTGFHPELTGRENVYLNGAILGMSRAEVRRKFDEIVGFAEVGQFIDTPVKRYSSGMYVRLAFAVAAHLEPEILIVDEVLAVGDAQFQRRCLGRMQSVAREGRTVLFVSHNIPAVRQLCSRSVVLRDGVVAYAGDTAQGIAAYLGDAELAADYTAPAGSGGEAVRIARVSLRNQAGSPCTQFGAREEIIVEAQVEVGAAVEAPLQVALRVSTADGTPVLTTSNADERLALTSLPRGSHRFRVALPGWLAPGRYQLDLAVTQPRVRVHAVLGDPLSFEVMGAGSLGQVLQDERLGLVEARLTWRHEWHG